MIIIIIIINNTIPNINNQQHAYAAQLWRCVASMKGVKQVVGRLSTVVTI